MNVKFEVPSFNCSVFLVLTVLKLLAFNAQKFRESRDHAPFLKIFKESYPDCPWKQARQIWGP